MKRLRLTSVRRKRFLQALSETGNVSAAIQIAGTSRTRVYELRKEDSSFAAAWEEAEERAADGLEAEARRRAVNGVSEPLVSAGKIVRDDQGQPFVVQRYSDHLLALLLRAHRPSRRERPIRFQLPALQSAADAVGAIAAITAGVAAGDLTPSEAAAFSKLVEAYVSALEGGEFDQRVFGQ